MTHLVSAEAMGAGRLNLKLSGSFYRQSKAFPTSPSANSQITTATAALAYGMNDYMDFFLAASAFNLRNGSVSGYNGSGLGTTVLGLQSGVPLALQVPAKLGIQIATLYGTSKNPLNSYGMDGYNYLETRTAPDVLLRLSQSLILSNMFKAHLNEGMLSSFQPGKQDALIGAAGLEFLPTSFLTLGVEANWRTFRTHPRLSDPLWITPSLTYSSPMAMGFQAGADISVARDRSTSPSRSLEPWRAFGSFTCSFNTLAGRKRLAAEKARRDSLEREALLEKVRRAEELRDSLTRQTALVDYLQAEQARRDSIRNATAAQEPSTMQQRTAPEQQLLSTGALLLDNCYFETGKTTVSINSKPYLNLIARMLTKYPKLRIEVAGHTDDVGGLNYNMNLSRLRAEAVMLYMTSVAPELRLTLTSQGYGPTKPWISNRTEEGRKYNRRTELRVLNKEMLQEYK